MGSQHGLRVGFERGTADVTLYWRATASAAARADLMLAAVQYYNASTSMHSLAYYYHITLVECQVLIIFKGFCHEYVV